MDVWIEHGRRIISIYKGLVLTRHICINYWILLDVIVHSDDCVWILLFLWFSNPLGRILYGFRRLWRSCSSIWLLICNIEEIKYCWIHCSALIDFWACSLLWLHFSTAESGQRGFRCYWLVKDITLMSNLQIIRMLLISIQFAVRALAETSTRVTLPQRVLRQLIERNDMKFRANAISDKIPPYNSLRTL